MRRLVACCWLLYIAPYSFCTEPIPQGYKGSSLVVRSPVQRESGPAYGNPAKAPVPGPAIRGEARPSILLAPSPCPTGRCGNKNKSLLIRP